MAKFETWLEMNLQLVDNGAALQKIVLEGPDGSVWGTWTREFPNLVQSITGMLGALRDELPKGKHSAKLVALGSDGTQLSCYPMTVVGASDTAHEAAQNQLTAQRANAMFLANVEKAQAGMMTIMQHTAEMVTQVVEANRNLTADAERFKAERDEGRLRVLKEEGKQRRLDEVATKILPLVELGLGLMTEFAADWFRAREEKQAALKSMQSAPALSTEGPSNVEQAGTTTSAKPDLSPDSGSNTQPGTTGGDVPGRDARNGRSVAGGTSNENRPATRRANPKGSRRK